MDKLSRKTYKDWDSPGKRHSQRQRPLIDKSGVNVETNAFTRMDVCAYQLPRPLVLTCPQSV